MLVIMCGYPYSGKSKFVDIMHSINNAIEIIRPEDWFDDMLTGDERKRWRIACWEHALDEVYNSIIENKSDHIIVLDTCGINPGALQTIIRAAKLQEHNIYAIVIGTPMHVCIQRNSSDISNDVIRGYAEKMPRAIMWYKEECNRIFAVRDGSISDWEARAKQIVDILSQPV